MTVMCIYTCVCVRCVMCVCVYVHTHTSFPKVRNLKQAVPFHRGKSHISPDGKGNASLRRIKGTWAGTKYICLSCSSKHRFTHFLEDEKLSKNNSNCEMFLRILLKITWNRHGNEKRQLRHRAVKSSARLLECRPEHPQLVAFVAPGRPAGFPARSEPQNLLRAPLPAGPLSLQPRSCSSPSELAAREPPCRLSGGCQGDAAPEPFPSGPVLTMHKCPRNRNLVLLTCASYFCLKRGWLW